MRIIPAFLSMIYGTLAMILLLGGGFAILLAIYGGSDAGPYTGIEAAMGGFSVFFGFKLLVASARKWIQAGS